MYMLIPNMWPSPALRSSIQVQVEDSSRVAQELEPAGSREAAARPAGAQSQS